MGGRTALSGTPMDRDLPSLGASQPPNEVRMAEINIERKERNAWPWLLAGVLLLGLLWFLFARNDNGTMTATSADSTAFRDSSAAAGTLAPPDTGIRPDTMSQSPSVPR